MFFEIKFSFFFSFSRRNGDTSERHQSAIDQGQAQMSRPIVSQGTIEPGAVTKEPVAASNLVRPVWSRVARYSQPESATQGEHRSETDKTRIADAHLAKINDRESLEILLRSISPAPSTDKANELSDPSLVHHSPVASTTTLPRVPFVVRQSPVLEDDSGSDLVSSLQRIRVGGLASYFEELEKRALARTLASTAAQVNVDRCSTSELEADQYSKAYDVTDGGWSEMTVREASDGE